MKQTKCEIVNTSDSYRVFVDGESHRFMMLLLGTSVNKKLRVMDEDGNIVGSGSLIKVEPIIESGSSGTSQSSSDKKGCRSCSRAKKNQ